MLTWFKRFFSPPHHQQKKILKHLLSLGSTAEEVANSLQQRNIKGTRHRCEDCPIANYLKMEGLVGERVFVGSMSISNKAGEGFRYYTSAPAVSQFVSDFDRGQYPQLEKESPPLIAGLSKEAQSLLMRAKNGQVLFDESERTHATQLINLGLGIWGDFYDARPEMTSTSVFLTKQATDVLTH